MNAREYGNSGVSKNGIPAVQTVIRIRHWIWFVIRVLYLLAYLMVGCRDSVGSEGGALTKPRWRASKPADSVYKFLLMLDFECALWTCSCSSVSNYMNEIVNCCWLYIRNQAKFNGRYDMQTCLLGKGIRCNISSCWYVYKNKSVSDSQLCWRLRAERENRYHFCPTFIDHE